jgi:hypothetical protein
MITSQENVTGLHLSTAKTRPETPVPYLLLPDFCSFDAAVIPFTTAFVCATPVRMTCTALDELEMRARPF